MVVMVSRYKAQGFTLIELVVVIIILAIVAITALIKFVNISDEANEVKVEAIAAAFQQSVKQVQIKWLIDGKPQNVNNQTGPTVEVEGNLVTVDQDTGLPMGNRGRDRANNIHQEDCQTIFSDIMSGLTVLYRQGNNNPNRETRASIDVISTRTNANPDSCHYYMTDSFSESENNPTNGTPTNGRGFTYHAGTGEITLFDFES